MANPSRALGICGVALILMACTTPPTAPVRADDACGAVALQGLVGRPADVLRTMRFGKTVRFIRPGTAVTKDYRLDRLNIWIDANEKISRVTCG